MTEIDALEVPGWVEAEWADAETAAHSTNGVAPHRDLFRRWSMPELLQAERTFQWLVRGYMVRPTYGMTAGDEKTLKTYIATMLALSVAAGVPLFGHFDIDQASPVILYVGEGGRVPYTRRLERVASSLSVDLRDVPLFASFDTAPVTSLVFSESLERDLHEIRPGLVIIDPLYAFHGAKTDPRNLHEEGALLSSVSRPCTEAGASLNVVNHFAKTATTGGLGRITMAGGKEWADSWWLVSHRDLPDVASGRFQLLLEIGSRQWGGANWDLDLEVGRFNVDLGEFDGDITWELRRHADGEFDDNDQTRVLAALADHPFEFTREELARRAGGQVKRIRQVIDQLQGRGVVTVALVDRRRTDGRTYRIWTYGVPSESDPPSDAGRPSTLEGLT